MFSQFSQRSQRVAQTWASQQTRNFFTQTFHRNPPITFTSSSIFPNKIPYKYTLPTMTIPAMLPAMMKTAPDQNELLAQIQSQEGTQADLQQKAILQQLIDRYGMNSDECKEFVLTTSDLTPNDEIRMLSPCGKFFTQSIFFHILFLRFGRNETDESARTAAIEYEQCLVSRVDEEIHFWQKAHELASISAGFIQNAKDQDDRHTEEIQSKDQNRDVHDAREETAQLQKIADDRPSSLG